MATFCWDETFRLNHPEIDHDHQIICDMMSTLETMIDPHGPVDGAHEGARIVHEMIHVVRHHFDTEAALMNGLPIGVYDDHIRRHVRAHEQFLLRLTALEQILLLDSGTLDIAYAERQGLLALLIDLLELDSELVGHLIREGLLRLQVVNG